MNKFYEIKEGSIREDLDFIQKLSFRNKKLDERQLWTKLCMHPKSHHNHGHAPAQKKMDEEDDDVQVEKRFTSHPKLLSDTETSMGDNSPRRINLSSSDSNILLDHNQAYVYEILEANKFEIKNSRKKLHKKLTQTKEDTSYHFDVGIGDSSSVSPRSTVGKRSVIFEDEKYPKGREVVPKIRSTKMKQKPKSAMTIPSKKMVPLKSPSLHSSYKSVLSDSVFEKKFKVFVEKSLHTITDIRALLETGITPPDGDEDESRRMVRVKEFSNRFSRNCLYPLARQLDHLNKMDLDDNNVNQKLLSSYQIILNGLQSYLNHLPTSIGACASDKLKSLLRHLLALCAIHGRANKRPDENGCSDFIDTFKLNAELTLQKIDEFFSVISTDSVLKSTGTKVSLQQYSSSKVTLKGGGALKKKKTDKRLSMYTMSAAFRRDANWRKAVDTVTKKKLDIKSRYKTSTFRHRPPLEKEPPIISFPSKCKLFCKKSSDTLRRTPVTTPVNEDNITTMVEMEEQKERGGVPERRQEVEAKPPLNHEEVVVKLLQLVLDNNQRKSEQDAATKEDGEGPTDADKQIADILERLRSDGNAETLRKIFDGLQGGKVQEPQQELKLQVTLASQSSLEEGPAKKRKEPTVTVTGEKNARLICIKDENSIVETESDAAPSAAPSESGKKCEAVKTEQQARPKEKEKAATRNGHKSANKAVKMNRLPKSSKVLRLLPKNYAVNIIQYKLDFHKSCKGNPMYHKTTNLEPWMLMGKISDKILDQALLGVAGEIEITDVVQKMYESELQL